MRRTLYALLLLLLAVPAMAQEPKPTNGAAAVTPPAPIDFEEQAIALRKQLLQTRKDAAIQPQLIAIREQLMKQVDSSPEVVAETKSIAEAEQKLGERKVKEAGKPLDKFMWDGKAVVEKPKEPQPQGTTGTVKR